MRFGFSAFTSCWMPRKLRQSSASILSVVLLALTVGTIVFTAGLRYPYTLPVTIHNTSSPDVCRQLDGNATLVIYDMSSSLLEIPDFECISTKTNPSVTVCLFDVWHDVYVSRSLQAAGVWEPYIVNEFTEAVRRGGLNAGVCILASICQLQSFVFQLLLNYMCLWSSVTHCALLHLLATQCGRVCQC